MIKNSRFKKLVASLIAVCMLGETTLFAAGTAGQFFTDIFGETMYSNITTGGFFEHKNADGSTSEYSAYIPGGVFFRFGAAFDVPEPIFSISQPSARMGCGGLSIKGMFVNIIGLDRLAAMLKNAGASLAWGVVVGLVYSLPGVGKAFQFLNTWANELQRMLANACQSGYNIGQAIGHSFANSDAVKSASGALSNWATDAANKFGMNDFVNKYDSLTSSTLKSFFGKLNMRFSEDMVFEGFGDYTAKELSKEQTAQLWGKLLKQSLVSKSFSTDFLMTIIDNQEISGDKKTEFIIKTLLGKGNGSIAALTDNGKKLTGSAFFAVTATTCNAGVKAGSNQSFNIVCVKDLIKGMGGQVKTSLTNQARISQTALAVALMKYLGRDSVVKRPQDFEKLLRDATKAITQDNSSGGGSTPSTPSPLGNDQPSDVSIKAVVGKDMNSNRTVDTASVAATQVLENIAEILLNGTEKSNGIKGSQEKLQFLKDLPAIGYGAVWLPYDRDVDQSNSAYIFFFALERAETAAIPYIDERDMTFKKGLLERSKTILEKIIAGYEADDSGNNAAGQNTTADIEKEADMVWVVPEVFRYLKTIQQSMSYDRADILDRLSTYNAYQVLDVLINVLINMQSLSQTAYPVAIIKNGQYTNINDNDYAPITDDNYRAAIASVNEAQALLREAYQTYIKKTTRDSLYSSWKELSQRLKDLAKTNQQRAIEAAPENPAN